MLNEFVKAFIAIFVVMDAIGNISIFSALNRKFSPKDRADNIKRAVTIATVVLLIFLFFGNPLLRYFGIRIPSFKIAGGIILMIIGLQIVLGLKFVKEGDLHQLAVVPMATPLITGPGVITTVLILVGTYGYVITLAASAVNLLVTYIVLRYSNPLLKFLGRQGADVVSRIMGLIIVAIAIEFIIQGIAAIV